MNQELTQIAGKSYITCQVAMLPTEKAIKVPVIQYFKDGTKSLDYWETEVQREYPINGKTEYEANCIVPQHIYILSNEEIKEGDWVLNTMHPNEGLIKVGINSSLEYIKIREQYKKIIATTNVELTLCTNSDHDAGVICNCIKLPRPSNSFVEAFIREFNKGNIISEVLVEYFDYSLPNGNKSYIGRTGDIIDISCKLKIAPDQTISIKRVVKKESWTREEIKQLFYDYLNTDYVHIHNSIGEAVELANIFLNKNL